MKRIYLLLFAFTLIINNTVNAQRKNLRKASTIGDVMSEDNKADQSYFGNWKIIDSLSDEEYIDLMPDQSAPSGQYLILKSSKERSAISSFLDAGYHSVDLGFYVYRKKNNFYANLDTSVAIMFEKEHKGHLIEFKCEYLIGKDQLKLTTSKNTVFYLKRFD